MDDEKKLAEQLFGRVKKIEASREIEVDENRLFEDFENKESELYLFCRGCGLYFEVDRKRAVELAEEAEVDLPDNFKKGMYFESDGCGACDGDNAKVKFKNLVQ
jgi:hypothetical protein